MVDCSTTAFDMLQHWHAINHNLCPYRCMSHAIVQAGTGCSGRVCL